VREFYRVPPEEIQELRRAGLDKKEINLVLLLGIQPVPASGQNGVTCHCFQNRSYNPSDRFAADDYILATGFNNLLARVFDVPHRQIVLLKMKEGVNEDELLIGMYVSRKSGEELEKILGKRRGGETWDAILATLTPESDAQHDEIFSRIYSGAKPGEAASLAADAIVREFYRVPPELPGGRCHSAGILPGSA
jgi:hypothetical protein